MPAVADPFGHEDLSRGASHTLSAPVRYAFWVGFAVAAFVTAITVFLTAAAPGASSAVAPGGLVLWVLSLNLLLILALAAGAGWQAMRLFAPREQDAGVRLHRRFVGLFALAAVLPAVIVALFFGLLVTRGVDTWFSSQVRDAVEGAAATSRAYVDEQLSFIESRLRPMIHDLNRTDIAVLFVRSRIGYSAFLSQAVEGDFAAVYVIDGKGRVMARAETAAAPAYVAPPPAAFVKASAASVSAAPGTPDQVDVQKNVIRALYRLSSYPDAYLYVVRPVRAGVLSQLRGTEAAVVSYREAEDSRSRIQIVFILSYASTALLVLVGAIGVGMTAATQIATPVARLVQAADRVAGGDLSARVAVDRNPEEIAVLSRAFNRMTSDLQEQQAALKTASLDAQTRRRFIEAVLSGVSAGVIGLDPNGRISAANDRALALLGLSEIDARGRFLAEAAPEMAGVVQRAADTGHDAETEVDVVREAETRRLRVRASGRPDGLVLTFDDITRLVTAQRNAAWRDVARRIAHEIKNPLTPIQLSAERLRRKYRSEIKHDLETFDRCTDTIIRQVGDIGRMVDEFSSFARMPAPKFTQVDAAELLRQAVFAQRVAYPEVSVELEDPTESVFSADSRMVGQALVNVLKNAGEAIATRRLKEPALEGHITARLVPSSRDMLFEVEDNGVGLPARGRERLIEPYVTTREKGTGLGLAIVKRILEEHGGELTLTDAAHLPGARARLRFPRFNAVSVGEPEPAVLEKT